MLFPVFTAVSNISMTVLIGKDLLSPLIVSSGKISRGRIAGSKRGLVFKAFIDKCCQLFLQKSAGLHSYQL